MTGEQGPLRDMTSAAYGVGRDSVAEVTAVGCQARFFLWRNMNRASAEEKHEAWHAPFEGIGRPLDSGSASALPIDFGRRQITRTASVDRDRNCDRVGKQDRQIPRAGRAWCALSSPGRPPKYAVDTKKGDTWQPTAAAPAIGSRLTP